MTDKEKQDLNDQMFGDLKMSQQRKDKLMYAWKHDDSTLEDVMLCFYDQDTVDSQLKKLKKKEDYYFMVITHRAMLYHKLVAANILDSSSIYNLKWGDLECLNEHGDMGIRGEDMFLWDAIGKKWDLQKD
jgi:hypothetical protein